MTPASLAHTTSGGERPLIALAGGGTGGHMFPAEATARALLERGARILVITDRRGAGFADRVPGVEVATVRSSAIGRGLLGKASTAFSLALGLAQARRLLKRHRPAAVVGFGGHASAPTVLAAASAGIPILLHDQNAHIGRVNRWLARRAQRIATSFPEVAGLPPAARAKTLVVGNPVRPAIAALHNRPYQIPTPDGPIHLLILGGSQGARIFTEIVPRALGRLPQPIRARLDVVQQCRPEDLDEAQAAYDHTGIPRELSSFFQDVPERLAAAHLVICRSGASTVAELCAAGRPAILVPYPFATDDHQTANAQAMIEAGAGWLVAQDKLSPEGLATLLQHVLADPYLLHMTADAAHGLARLDAADRLAEEALALAGAPAVHGGDGGRPAPVREATA